MRALIVLLVLVVGLLHVLDGQLATFEPPKVEPLPTVIVAAPVTPVPTVVVSPSGNVLQALFDAARSWLGTPYLFGGCSRRGIDCSCLQQIAFAAIGVRLPRTTVEQIRVATPIAAADARPGDLVFFRQTCSNCGADPTHVGLVIDSGHNLMLDAGDPVKIESFDTPYWRGHYMATGRVL